MRAGAAAAACIATLLAGCGGGGSGSGVAAGRVAPAAPTPTCDRAEKAVRAIDGPARDVADLDRVMVRGSGRRRARGGRTRSASSDGARGRARRPRAGLPAPASDSTSAPLDRIASVRTSTATSDEFRIASGGAGRSRSRATRRYRRACRAGGPEALRAQARRHRRGRLDELTMPGLRRRAPPTLHDPRCTARPAGCAHRPPPPPEERTRARGLLGRPVEADRAHRARCRLVRPTASSSRTSGPTSRPSTTMRADADVYTLRR